MCFRSIVLANIHDNLMYWPSISHELKKQYCKLCVYFCDGQFMERRESSFFGRPNLAVTGYLPSFEVEQFIRLCIQNIQ